MPAFYRATVAEFLSTSETELTGRLSLAYASSGFSSQRTSQTRAWIADLLRLRQTLGAVASALQSALKWHILLEFPIPRKEKRIDVVLLATDQIIILEFKTTFGGNESLRQVEEYALLLHYFHEPSNRRRIRTFVVAPDITAPREDPQIFLPLLEAPAYWISRVEAFHWSVLSSKLLELARTAFDSAIDPVAWDCGEYRPVPSIIDAALSLRSGLNVREIAHSRAARHDVEHLSNFVSSVIDDARTHHLHAICFVTGVPGSGKTLVGLKLSFGSQSHQDPIHFMSGTGPLVSVLQAVLAEYHRSTTGTKAEASRMFAKTLIENVHVFASTYSEDPQQRAPSNHIVIFDEAQRAWERKQNWLKFKRDYSEPEMLLKIMERHPDWAVVIALVGGGQEINSGEAGLSEWGRALAKSSKPWKTYASPEALRGGPAVAGTSLFVEEETHGVTIVEEPQLHLGVAVRSLKADSYAAWANAVVEGDMLAAAEIGANCMFPILLTRSFSTARSLLQIHTLGLSRCGLVGSSGATRLRAEGLEPDSAFHAEYPWPRWYLGDRSDVRSSYQLEVFATEFEIQGLELDWVGLCWGNDFFWSARESRWIARKLSHGRVTKWSKVKDERRQEYRRNAYRVLLTRARQGIVLFVPEGNLNDATLDPQDFEGTAAFLLACGAHNADVTPGALDVPSASETAKPFVLG